MDMLKSLHFLNEIIENLRCYLDGIVIPIKVFKKNENCWHYFQFFCN